MRIGWIFLVLFVPLIAVAQVTMKVDKTDIEIGDQVKATIVMDDQVKATWRNRSTFWPDSVPGIELVSGPDSVLEGKQPSYQWTLAFFDTGYVMIPSLPVAYGDPASPDTVYTSRIPVKVAPVLPDSAGLIDIRDIYHHPFDPSYYLRYLPVLILCLLGIVILWWWWRRRQNKVVLLPPQITLQPHEWADQALLDLAEKKWWQRGEIKTHYTELTSILREYLERRFHIHAMEQTTDEILASLQKKQLHASLLTDTESLLNMADLIKFAKADPGMDIHAASIERVRRFVHETMPIPVSLQPEQPGTQDVDS